MTVLARSGVELNEAGVPNVEFIESEGSMTMPSLAAGGISSRHFLSLFFSFISRVVTLALTLEMARVSSSILLPMRSNVEIYFAHILQ